MTDAIRYEKGPDNIVVLTMDMPGQSANTMNAVYREAMGQTVARLEAEKESIAGVIVTSASPGSPRAKSRPVGRQNQSPRGSGNPPAGGTGLRRRPRIASVPA